MRQRVTAKPRRAASGRTARRRVTASLVRAASERSPPSQTTCDGRPAAGRRRRWRRSRRPARSGRSPSPAAASVKPIPSVSSTPSPFGRQVRGGQRERRSSGAVDRERRRHGAPSAARAIVERVAPVGEPGGVYGNDCCRAPWTCPVNSVATTDAARVRDGRRHRRARAERVRDRQRVGDRRRRPARSRRRTTAARRASAARAAESAPAAAPCRSSPLAGRVVGPASIVHVYEPGATPAEFHVHDDRRAGAVAAARRPSRPRCAPSPPTRRGAESRAVKTTGPPSAPVTDGA